MPYILLKILLSGYVIVQSIRNFYALTGGSSEYNHADRHEDGDYWFRMIADLFFLIFIWK